MKSVVTHQNGHTETLEFFEPVKLFQHEDGRWSFHAPNPGGMEHFFDAAGHYDGWEINAPKDAKFVLDKEGNVLGITHPSFDKK